MRVRDYAKDAVKDRIVHLHFNALMILCEVIKWGVEKQIAIVVCDAVTDIHEDMALNRTSSTHREARAFDISTKGWKMEDVEECKRIFSMKYRHLAALGEDGEPRLIVYHDAGTGNHLHFQIHKKFALSLMTFNSFDDITKMS